MPKQSLEYNQIFHALADPTRRAVIERLSLGSATVSQLASPFTMALPSFVQHLGVLEKSGLVHSKKTGRVRTYHLEPETIQQVEHWLSTQRHIWETRLDQLDSYLMQIKPSLEPNKENHEL